MMLVLRSPIWVRPPRPPYDAITAVVRVGCCFGHLRHLLCGPSALITRAAMAEFMAGSDGPFQPATRRFEHPGHSNPSGYRNTR